MLYVKSSNVAGVQRLPEFDPETTNNPFADRTHPDYADHDANLGGHATLEGGIPLNRPPYAVAVDLDAGDIAWRSPPAGTATTCGRNPPLCHLDLPGRLPLPGAPGAIVARGGLAFVAGSEEALYAFDKRTGREVRSAPLTGRSATTPMTYRTESGRSSYSSPPTPGPARSSQRSRRRDGRGRAAAEHHPMAVERGNNGSFSARVADCPACMRRHPAVLMREHGTNRICTRDADFCRFPFLTVVDPLTETRDDR